MQIRRTSTLQALGTSILQPVIMSLWKQYPTPAAQQEHGPCHGQGLSHHKDINHHSSPTGAVEAPRAHPQSRAQRPAPREPVLFHGMASQGAEHPRVMSSGFLFGNGACSSSCAGTKLEAPLMCLGVFAGVQVEKTLPQHIVSWAGNSPCPVLPPDLTTWISLQWSG